jgi:hypothetical protein
MNSIHLTIVLLLQLAVTAGDASVQEAWQPLIVSPLIGDTLDARERDTYVLFRDFGQFQWAVFFLGPDSMVRARIAYLRGETTGFDTLETGFSLYALRNRIEKTYSLFLERSLKKDETEIEVRLRNGKELKGEFLAVRDSSIVLATDSSLAGSRTARDWKSVSAHPFRDIESILIPGTSWTALGALIGAGLGAAGGSAATDEKGFLAPSKSQMALAGGILGGLLGLAIGSGASIDDVTYSARDFELLKPHARFDRVEPEYLREIR